MIEQRFQRLRNALQEANADVFLITHTSDIRWLTGFASVFDTEQAHLALIPRDPSFGAPALFTDARYSGALRELDREGHWRILDERRPRFAYVVEVLGELFDTRIAADELRVGIESDLRLDAYRAFERALDESPHFSAGWKQPLELSETVPQLRAVKDTQEIAQLKAAQAITDAAFTHMLDILRPGLTEREVATELEFFMRRTGADGLAFPSIVATGPNSAIPHAVPGDRILEPGAFVLMDFGARLGDYCSDMTRTVVLGKANEQQQAMYAAVLAAQTKVIETLKAGMTGKEAQSIAEEVFAATGFAENFTHSLGHGVGIDIHELPLLSPKAEEPLSAGHVVTVEPGVYLEGVGGVRIEDYGVITEQGFEDFTQSPHNLIEL
jgi:Xaa-Pro aminopeptidase